MEVRVQGTRRAADFPWGMPHDLPSGRMFVIIPTHEHPRPEILDPSLGLLGEGP